MLSIFLFSSTCNSSSSDSKSLETKSEVIYTFNLAIGVSDQSEDYLLGKPIGIRTDSKGYIYIADRAQMKIKKFTNDGIFVEDIGRRGRGPGEFQDINTFEITPSEDFIIVDRGNLRYSSITKSGEQIFTEPIEIKPEWQFYPDDIDFVNDTLISLFQEGASIEYAPRFQRDLFYLHSDDLSTKLGSFFPFEDLDGLDDNFSWIHFLGRPGSFVINNDKTKLFYSPEIYTGILYSLTRNGNTWIINNKIKGIKPYSCLLYTSDAADEN